MSFRKALENLRAYTPKRLAWRSYLKDGVSCAIGAIAPTTHGKVDFIIPVCRIYQEAALEICSLGLSGNEAESLQLVNDQFEGSPEARYLHVLAWLERQVSKEAIGS